MGLSYSHTGEVRCKNQRLARACSFESIPRTKSAQWKVHKGVIMERWGKFKTWVEVPTSIKDGSSQVEAEVEKFNFAKSVLQRCPEVAKRVELIPVYQADIVKIGRGSRSKGNFRQRSRVAVQERLDEPLESLLELESGGLQRIRHLPAGDEALLMTLVHESYSCSGGECVIAGMEGVKLRDVGGPMTYLVTSLTIHSLGKKFGASDRGFEGVLAYKNWNFPPQRHTSPPPRRVGISNAVPSAPVGIPELTSLPSRYLTSLPAESLGSNLPVYVDLLEGNPRLRDLTPEDCLRVLLGQPPQYSFTSKNLRSVGA